VGKIFLPWKISKTQSMMQNQIRKLGNVICSSFYSGAAEY
jgi:hypothetical protein